MQDWVKWNINAVKDYFLVKPWGQNLIGDVISEVLGIRLNKVNIRLLHTLLDLAFRKYLATVGFRQDYVRCRHSR